MKSKKIVSKKCVEYLNIWYMFIWFPIVNIYFRILVFDVKERYLEIYNI